MPGVMAAQYLCGLCQSDRFANDGRSFCDTVERLSYVDVALCAIG